MLVVWKTIFYLLPSAVGYFQSAYLIVQKTEICHYAAFIFKNERIGNSFLEEILGILEKKIVKVIVAAVEIFKLIDSCQSCESHNLKANSYTLQCLFIFCTKFLLVLRTGLLTEAVYFLHFFYEALCIGTCENRSLFYWSCHNNYDFCIYIYHLSSASTPLYTFLGAYSIQSITNWVAVLSKTDLMRR